MGALECWPTNVVGEADSPCLFELVAAGDQVHSDDVYDDEDEDDNDDQLSYAGYIIVITNQRGDTLCLFQVITVGTQYDVQLSMALAISSSHNIY